MRSSAIEFTSDPFSVKFLSCDREPGEWDKEVFKAAFSLIGQAGNRPIVVCFSGGVDSEVLCQALFEQGVHFSTLTVADSKGYNENEVQFSTDWCRSRGIAQKIVRLDYEDFYKNEVERYISEGYFAVNLFRYFQLFLLEQVQTMGGFAVLGGGEPRLSVTEGAKETKPHILFTTAAMSPLLWMQKNKATHQPFFYLSSPELVLSYLRTPIVDVALSNPKFLRNRMNRYMLKHFVQYAYRPGLQIGRKPDNANPLGVLWRKKEKELLLRLKEEIHMLRLPVKDIRAQLEKNLRSSKR